MTGRFWHERVVTVGNYLPIGTRWYVMAVDYALGRVQLVPDGMSREEQFEHSVWVTLAELPADPIGPIGS